jgi:hypothetical protein
MKTYIKRMLESALDAFRMPTEEGRALHHQLANYESQARQLRDLHQRSSDLLPIGDDRAMRLQAGNAYQLGVALYRVSIHDRSGGTKEQPWVAPFAAFGETAAEARARAEQLISALDGARRL